MSIPIENFLFLSIVLAIMDSHNGGRLLTDLNGALFRTIIDKTDSLPLRSDDAEWRKSLDEILAALSTLGNRELTIPGAGSTHY